MHQPYVNHTSSTSLTHQSHNGPASITHQPHIRLTTFQPHVNRTCSTHRPRTNPHQHAIRTATTHPTNSAITYFRQINHASKTSQLINHTLTTHQTYTSHNPNASQPHISRKSTTHQPYTKHIKQTLTTNQPYINRTPTGN